MPIFEYKCNVCKANFEEFVRTQYDVVLCPVCNTEDIKKLISPSAFHLKGTGWAKDGYSKAGSKK